MNKTEQNHAWILESEKQERKLVDYRFEEIKLIIAPKTTYTPDFFVVYEDRFEFHEIKGEFVREDAWIKLKTCAAKFPWIGFKMFEYKKNGLKITKIY